MSGECMLCARVAGPEPEGGWVYRDEHWAVSIHPAVPAPGWMAVQTVRHLTSFAELDAAAAAALGPLLRRLAAAVQAVAGTDQVYSYVLGETVRHLHILTGPPLDPLVPSLRGRALLTRILGRDDTLVARPASEITARLVAGRLQSATARQNERCGL